MKWALKNSERIEASPQQKAICPLCNGEVIAKCGEIKIWHWCHKSNQECDSFKEPETEWHFGWKDMFEKEMQEVAMGEHRADIQNKKGLILEFQNSPISAEQIAEREDFYENMVWILNGETLAKNFDFRYKGKEPHFNWKWFPKSWRYSNKPIFIDVSYWDKDILFKIVTLSKEGDGVGKRISKTAFIVDNGGKSWLKNDVKSR